MADETRDTALFSLAVFKTWMKITDSTEDLRLVTAANAATEEIEQYLGLFFVQRSRTSTVNGNGKAALILPDGPLVSFESLTIDGALVPSSAYQVDLEAGIVYLTGACLTIGVQNVVSAYTVGFDVQDGPALPADISLAALNLAKAKYDELQSGTIAATSVSLGPSTMVVKAAGWPPSVKMAVDNWDGVGYRP